MTTEQMKQALQDVNLLEKDLMRELTPEETELVFNCGFRALFNKLQFTDEDFKTLRAVRQLISAYCTQSVDEYEAELANDNYGALDVLKTIVNDLIEVEEKQNTSTVKIGSEKELGTHIKVKSPVNQLDRGYMESEDPELNSYFSKESTKEAHDALDTYDPETDLELNARFNTNKEELNPIETYKKYVNVSIEDYIKLLKTGKELTLPYSIINKIIEYLWQTESSVKISVVNGKIKVS